MAKSKRKGRGAEISDQRRLQKIMNWLYAALTENNRSNYRKWASELATKFGKTVKRYRDAIEDYKKALEKKEPADAKALGLVT